MRIRSYVPIWTLTLAAVVVIPQSAIQSAIRKPQSALRYSAIRNPPSAMPASASASWRVLFDGKSLNAWRGYKTDKIPDGWKIVNGTLAKETPVADIVSKD